MLACGRCAARQDASQVVGGEGPDTALVVFVGRNPGADEDESGRPFVGRAGRMLDKVIKRLGLDRDSVGVVNSMRCYTKGNRVPTQNEINACKTWLRKELDFFPRKKVIVALGTTAMDALWGPGHPGLTGLMGSAVRGKGFVLIPFFHPSALLRNQGMKDRAWRTLPKIRRYLQETQPESLRES